MALRAMGALCAAVLITPLSLASNFGDAARQLADRIAAVSGPGSMALEITNRSSLDEKLLREIRSVLQTELRAQGVRIAAADQSVGTVAVILSESLREYVWTAQIAIGTDSPRVVLVSLPRDLSAVPLSSPLPVALRKTFLFSQQEPILDAVVLADARPSSSAQPADSISGAHLLVLDPARVAEYRQQNGHWELEAALPISHIRPFPRDPRGRLLLRRDHLFDAYLPGTICRSSTAAPLAMNCQASDDPWPLNAGPLTTAPLTTAPLTTDDNNGQTPGLRAFFAPARNFFTGALSPGIGKISNVPSFYSAAALPRSNYTLWLLTAVDGSVHLIDGITDQAVRAGRAGSDVAAVHSTCGTGSQLLVSEYGEPDRDTLRAFEIPDRDPVAVSVPLDFDGRITALWPDPAFSGAVAVMKREDNGWYEANRISVSCAN